jgi:ubiquinone/menaquinone biosynthesis C-methylase UbiE
VNYADITFHDLNPIKRYLQRHRLKDAVRLCRAKTDANVIVDFGAGNGELCMQLSGEFPAATIYCYEPHQEFLDQARDNLKHIDNIIFCSDPAQLASSSADILFCLEVFEHLPEKELDLALKQFKRMLAVDGIAVIGVPVETGLPALYKGIFRMLRRFGEFDAQFKQIISAVFGRPVSERPKVKLLQGGNYHPHHLGFDHRQFRDVMSCNFNVLKISASPFPILGLLVNPEANFLVKRI